jgi:competence protein ComEC
MFILKICFVVSLLSGVLLWRFYSFYQSQPTYKGGQIIRLQTMLQEEPDLTNKGQRFSIKTPVNQRISITAQSFPRYAYGEVIEISGLLQEKRLDNGSTFYSMYYPEIVVKSESENVVFGWAKAIREKSKSLYEATLPPLSASLLMGIVFGAKEHFPKNFFYSLRATGVLHVIAASGMNVTFVAAALLYILGTIMRRQIALLFGCLGIIFYLFLVGFEPSILRASIMGLLAFGASLLGRQHIAVYAVLVSAYLMLLWQPAFLFDLGFQLSFLATLGILFIQPILPIPKNFLTEPIATTIAAQIGTLPILLGVFGQFGMLSILVNAVVLWTVPIVMLLGSLGAIVGLLIPPFGQVLIILCLPFLLFFETVISFFGGAMWVLSVGSLGWPFSVGYYLLVCAVVLLKKPEQKAVTLEEHLSFEKY